jgi:diadenosine tetraphosphate (Ap4A) HIT family hydrolase
MFNSDAAVYDSIQAGSTQRQGVAASLDVNTERRNIMNLTCAACTGQWPRPDHRIADCGTSIAYLFEDQFFSGWTVLVLKRHATELFQLSANERHRMIDEVSETADALTQVFHPIKINYELLGNQVPHIHWHLIPRLPEDPSPRDAVWTVKHERRPLAPADLEERVALIRSRLSLKGHDDGHGA